MDDLETSQLRVTRVQFRKPKNAELLATSRIILLQHVLQTTKDFVEGLLESGAEIHSFLAKPYSINREVFDRLRKRKLNLVKIDYDELDTTDYLEELLVDAIEKSRRDKKKVLILEVGGYFARTLSRIKGSHIDYITGVVEDTTYGHNRYRELVEEIPVPVFSVARSELKEMEARY